MMIRSKFLISVAAFAATIVGCGGKDSRGIPRSLVGPTSQPGYVFGYVFEPQSVPVAGVAVTITDGPFKGQAAPTDAHGLYEIPNVNGEFTLSFQKQGYATTTRHANTSDTIQINADIVPVTPQVDVSGNWSVAFTPSSQCKSNGAEAIAALDSLQVTASIVQRGARLELTLTGGGMQAPGNLEGTIQGTEISITVPPPCDYYCSASTPPPPVTSKLPDGRYLMLGGTVSATLRPNSIAGTLSGTFLLTSSAFEWIAACNDNRHEVTFTR